MLDLAKSSIILFFQGNLFQNPSGVWRQLAIGIGLTLVIFLAAVKIAGFGLPLAAAIASFIGGAAHQLIGDVARFEAINAGFRNGPSGVKSLLSASPTFGAPRGRADHCAVARAALSICSVVFVTGLLLPFVVDAFSRHIMPSEETASRSVERGSPVSDHKRASASLAPSSQ